MTGPFHAVPARFTYAQGATLVAPFFCRFGPLFLARHTRVTSQDIDAFPAFATDSVNRDFRADRHSVEQCDHVIIHHSQATI